MTSLGVRHHWIRPYTPKHNGKVEGYNRLMVDEVLYARPYTSEAQRRETLAVWVHLPSASCFLRGRPAGPGACQQRHGLLQLVVMSRDVVA